MTWRTPLARLLATVLDGALSAQPTQANLSAGVDRAEGFALRRSCELFQESAELVRFAVRPQRP